MTTLRTHQKKAVMVALMVLGGILALHFSGHMVDVDYLSPGTLKPASYGQFKTSH